MMIVIIITKQQCEKTDWFPYPDGPTKQGKETRREKTIEHVLSSDQFPDLSVSLFEIDSIHFCLAKVWSFVRITISEVSFDHRAIVFVEQQFCSACHWTNRLISGHKFICSNQMNRTFHFAAYIFFVDCFFDDESKRCNAKAKQKLISRRANSSSFLASCRVTTNRTGVE